MAKNRHIVTPVCYAILRVGRSRIYRDNAERQAAYRERMRRRQPVYHRHQSDLWETPAVLFATLHAEFSFTLDVAALPFNAKCARYFTPGQDGLKQCWEGVCWMNPPYGPHLRAWVQKARQSAEAGAIVVCLLPARTDTHWWHEHVLPHAEVRYLRGRLKFNGVENSAPFPSAVVIFRPAKGNELLNETLPIAAPES